MASCLNQWFSTFLYRRTGKNYTNVHGPAPKIMADVTNTGVVIIIFVI